MNTHQTFTCSKSATEQRHWRQSGAVIANFERISYFLISFGQNKRYKKWTLFSFASSSSSQYYF